MRQLCKCTLSIASLKSVQIVVSNEPRKTRPSVNTARTNIPRLYRFYQFFVWFISFILDRKRSIVSKSEKTSSPLPPTRYLKNSLPRRFMLIWYGNPRWSTGNRGRATSGGRGRVTPLWVRFGSGRQVVTGPLFYLFFSYGFGWCWLFFSSFLFFEIRYDSFLSFPAIFIIVCSFLLSFYNFP